MGIIFPMLEYTDYPKSPHLSFLKKKKQEGIKFKMKLFSHYKTSFGQPGPHLKTTGEEKKKGAGRREKNSYANILPGNLSLFPN